MEWCTFQRARQQMPRTRSSSLTRRLRGAVARAGGVGAVASASVAAAGAPGGGTVGEVAPAGAATLDVLPSFGGRRLVSSHLVSILPQHHLMRIASNDAHFRSDFFGTSLPLTLILTTETSSAPSVQSWGNSAASHSEKKGSFGASFCAPFARSRQASSDHLALAGAYHTDRKSPATPRRGF